MPSSAFVDPSSSREDRPLTELRLAGASQAALRPRLQGTTLLMEGFLLQVFERVQQLPRSFLKAVTLSGTSGILGGQPETRPLSPLSRARRGHPSAPRPDLKS